MINPATFVLMVIIGTSPPQQRGVFHSYHQCYEAAQGEVANRGPDVRWDCVPKSSVEGPAPGQGWLRMRVAQGPLSKGGRAEDAPASAVLPPGVPRPTSERLSR